MKNRLTHLLWWLYGYTYDGLLRFWPYTYLLKLVVDYLEPKAGERILELGCGTGNVLVRVLETPATEVVGIDLSSSMLKIARRKLRRAGYLSRSSLNEGDLLAWLKEQPTASFDAGVAVNVIYAINDQTTLWREVHRVIKPDGRFVATTSVRPGSKVIIDEQLANDRWWRLLTPRLLGVFIIDAVINLLGRSGTFAFHDEAALRKEVAINGGTWDDRGYCYGGPEVGVNILFRVTIPT